MKSDFVKESTYKDFVQRGFKVYDAANHTYDIGSNYDHVFADLIIQLDFDDLPEVAKRYIGLKAARVFQDRTTGATDLHGFQQEDEFIAFADLKDTEGENGEHNIFQDYSVYSVVDRAPGGGQRLRYAH